MNKIEMILTVIVLVESIALFVFIANAFIENSWPIKIREKIFANNNHGSICHFSDDGIEWHEKTLIGCSTPEYDCQKIWDTNIRSYVFCYEYQLHINRIPDGWTNPLLDDEE